MSVKPNVGQGACKCRGKQGKLLVAAFILPGTMAARFRQMCVPNTKGTTKAKSKTEC